MIVKFEIKDWADWTQFNTLFAKLHAADVDLADLAEWMRTREIEVRCQKCGWQGELAEAIKEANRTVGAPPIRCPQCKQYGGTDGQGFEVVPTTFTVDLSDLDLDDWDTDHEPEQPGWADYYPDWRDYITSEYPEAMGSDPTYGPEG